MQQTNVEFSSDNAMDNLTEKLSIMSSLCDVHEPILYQLIEGTVSASLEKDRLSRLSPEPSHYQAKAASIPHITNIANLTNIANSQPAQASASSSSSIDKSDKPTYGKYDYASEYKDEKKTQEESLPALAVDDEVEEMDYDDNDDSFAESKEAEAFKPNTEDKQAKETNEMKMKDENQSEDKKVGVFDLPEHKAVYEPQQSDDEKSYSEAPEVDDIEEEDIEIEGGDESSASFSLEYGYVEDQPTSGRNDNVKQVSPDKSTDKSTDKNTDMNTDKYTESKDGSREQPGSVTAARSTILSVKGLKGTPPSAKAVTPPDASRSDAVGVQKLAQVVYTRMLSLPPPFLV